MMIKYSNFADTHVLRGPKPAKMILGMSLTYNSSNKQIKGNLLRIARQTVVQLLDRIILYTLGKLTYYILLCIAQICQN